MLDSFVGADLAARAQDNVLDFLRSILTSEADSTLEAASELFTESRPGLLTFSLLASFWALSRGFAALVRALDVVYDLDEHRKWLHIRGTAIALTLGSVVAAAVMLVDDRRRSAVRLGRGRSPPRSVSATSSSSCGTSSACRWPSAC